MVPEFFIDSKNVIEGRQIVVQEKGHFTHKSLHFTVARFEISSEVRLWW